MRSRKDGGVEAPICLNGLFYNSDDSDCDENTFEDNYENQKLLIGDLELNIRQGSWHRTNANKVWPGTFVLADFLTDKMDRYGGNQILELGSATGALAIYLRHKGLDITTCDIDDEGEVEEYIKINSEQNGLSFGNHIPHSWGTSWNTEKNIGYNYKFIIASDILLYVSAYADLVKTIETIFHHNSDCIEFVMAWNRRIADSVIFFNMMKNAGFYCYHHGKCVYSFFKENKLDDYLTTLLNQLKANNDNNHHHIASMYSGGSDNNNISNDSHKQEKDNNNR